MTLIKVLAVALSFTVLGQDYDAKLVIGGKHIFVYNAGHYFYKPPKPDDLEAHLSIKSDGAELICLEMGLHAKAREMESRWAQINPKTVEIRYARLEGKASITLDSDAAYRAQLDNATQQKIKPPAGPLESSVSKVESDQFLYTGTASKGTLAIPNPWTLNQASKGIVEKTDKNGKKTHVAFDQTVDASGTKGQIQIGIGKDGTLDHPEIGAFEGPVHLKVVRHETPEGSDKTSTSTYTIAADHVDFDLTTHPGTVTATGHVTIDSQTDEGASTIKASQLVVTVSDTYEPLEYHVVNVVANAVPKPKGGSK